MWAGGPEGPAAQIRSRALKGGGWAGVRGGWMAQGEWFRNEKNGFGAFTFDNGDRCRPAAASCPH